MKHELLLLLCIFSLTSWGQDKKYVQSENLDLPLVGCNKVLCMKNGYTLLFHLECKKNIAVKVFDSTHHLVAGTNEPCFNLDNSITEGLVFKGLYEIDKNAVLFIEQEKHHIPTLIKLTYNGETGKLINDKIIGVPPKFAKRIYYYPVKCNEGYAVLFNIDEPKLDISDLHVKFYSINDEIKKSIKIEIDKSSYENLKVLGVENQLQGLFISLDLEKGGNITLERGENVLKVDSKLQKHILNCYIPKGSTEVYKNKVELPENFSPLYSLYTYNEFASTLNSFVFCYKKHVNETGQISWDYTIDAANSNLFFKISETDMSIESNKIQNKLADSFLKNQNAEDKDFVGVPFKMLTNRNGLSTLFSQSIIQHNEKGNFNGPIFEDFLGSICVTQFDDDGKEMWGGVLPMLQNYKSNVQHYSVYQRAKRWQQQQLFIESPSVEYSKQFFSTSEYCYKYNTYILFNDLDNNANCTLQKPCDTVKQFEYTNTYFYKIDRKGVITKGRLNGNLNNGEYKCTFIEGTDFDEKRGILASLIQCKKEGTVSLCMAWNFLD